MPKIWRVYSGSDGKSHIAELPLAMRPFLDVEGAHGEASPTQPATGITFRVSPPGYVLDWHCAPRRQYSISLSGLAEIEVGDGTVARVGPGDVVLAEDLTGQGHVTRVVGDQPRFSAIVPLGMGGLEGPPKPAKRSAAPRQSRGAPRSRTNSRRRSSRHRP